MSKPSLAGRATLAVLLLIGFYALALGIVAALLRDGRVDTDGTYYRALECELRPRGPRGGGPPIMVGAAGERMLRLAARYADAWNGE